jgi:hypothetical protein
MSFQNCQCLGCLGLSCALMLTFEKICLVSMNALIDLWSNLYFSMVIFVQRGLSPSARRFEFLDELNRLQIHPSSVIVRSFALDLSDSDF